jgi:hypothetical protein
VSRRAEKRKALWTMTKALINFVPAKKSFFARDDQCDQIGRNFSGWEKIDAKFDAKFDAKLI